MSLSLLGNTEARLVDKGKHAGHAFVRSTNQIAFGAVKVHYASGVAVNAHFLFDGTSAHTIGFAFVAIGVHLELRHDKQGDAFNTLWRIGQACQHDVHHIVSQIVVARGDKYLTAGDAVGAVCVWLGFSAQQP